jgi:hypothetical protein
VNRLEGWGNYLANGFAKFRRLEQNQRHCTANPIKLRPDPE